MENKHTPAPWAIRYPEGFKYVIIANGRPAICSINGLYGDLERSEEFESENLANAKLIAAAPDLLQALKEVTDTLESVLISPYCQVPDDGTIEWSRNIIKKATE